MVQAPRDRLIRFATSLSVLAAFSTLSFPVVLPYIFGSLALILAILSKGGSERFPLRGKRAAAVAIVAILINTGLIISSVTYLYRVMHDPQLQEQFSQTLYRMYGITFEDLMNQFGIQSAGTL